MITAETAVATGTHREPTLATAMAHLAVGDGALAVLEIQAVRAQYPGALAAADAHYWLGLAHLLAFDWQGAVSELRAFLSREAVGWRVGWAYLHLGRAYEQSAHEDEAALAYRGCLAATGTERAARKFAFEQMSRLATSLPIGYGQTQVRRAGEARSAGKSPSSNQ